MIPQTYHMANSLDDVDRMVLSLKTTLEEALDGVAAFRFEVCASEALTNLVKHSNAPNKDEPIQIELAKSESGVSLVIFDPVGADPFDLRDHARDLNDVDPMAEGGRGLGLIIQCADAVTYGEQNGRTRLVLTFSKSGDL